MAAPRVMPAPAAIAAVAPQAPAIQVTPESPTLAPAEAPVVPTTEKLAPETTHAMAPSPNVAALPTQRSRPPKRPAATATSLPAPAASPGKAAGEAVSRSPSEVCAGRNFVARAICVSRRCQAAGAHVYPECVKARRIEEQRQRAMDR